LIGKTISHYRVLREIGRGGMGVVYEAEDTLLGRHVALKFLPENVASDPQALARFQREARAASSLNHPNICTIYDIGEDQTHWFIAMELLEGELLDNYLMGGPVATDKLLDWGIQIADALDAAHTKSIVHRDLKPANIYLTKRGVLKVLDFGLAKVADAVVNTDALTSPGTPTAAPALTSPGLVVGTIAYMSPEQARGDELDARSDLFSFGTLLYQLATGRIPFEGKTTAIIFDGIMNREPAPISAMNTVAPPDLQRIVGRCLEKDPDLRYQHASDLRSDLKRLRRDTSSAARYERQPTPLARASAAASVSGAPLPVGPGASTSSVQQRPSSSSAVVAAAREHRIGFALGSIIVAVLLAAAGFGVYALLHRTAAVPFQNMAITQITSNGDTWAAAISPDGKYVALVRRETDGRPSLWMRHLPTNSNTQIVPPADGRILGLAFGFDGNYVYYALQPTGSGLADVYRVPVLGGTPALVVHNSDSAPSFYAAGARLCFLRTDAAKNQQSLVSANLDGSEEKVIWSGKPTFFNDLAWSPDGKHVLLSQTGKLDIAMIDVATGAAGDLAKLPDPNFEPDYFVWAPDGNGYFVTYRNMNLGYRQIAYFTYPKGEFHPLTNDLNAYGALSLSADGKTLSTVVTTREESFGLYPMPESRITASPSTTLQSVYWFDWLDNRRIVARNNDMGIEVIDIVTQKRTPVFSSSDFYTYDLDACGPNTVVFTGDEHKGDSFVYAVDLSGGSPRKITPEPHSQYMRCTADGQWLVYFNFKDWGIRKIAMSGGSSEVLVHHDRHPDPHFSLTPDGRSLVVNMQAATNGQREIDFVSLASGQVERRITVPGDSSGAYVTPDGQNIGTIRRIHGVDNLWLQPINGGSLSQLTDFRLEGATEVRIGAIGWSPDGKVLGIGARHYRSDAILLKQQGR